MTDENKADLVEKEEKLAGSIQHLFPKNLAFSQGGEHMWFLDVSRKSFVGFHNDRVGTWIDLRSAAATNYPEFAVCVPTEGGKIVLQVSDGKNDPITLDLLKAAALLNKLLGADESATTGA